MQAPSLSPLATLPADFISPFFPSLYIWGLGHLEASTPPFAQVRQKLVKSFSDLTSTSTLHALPSRAIGNASINNKELLGGRFFNVFSVDSAFAFPNTGSSNKSEYGQRHQQQQSFYNKQYYSSSEPPSSPSSFAPSSPTLTSATTTLLAPEPTNTSSSNSSLSPLNSASPLYPDGIIHPLWIQKVTRQVPSVVVAFFDLSDRTQVPSPTGAVKDPLGNAYKEHLAAEREKDAELCNAINERKKFMVEKGLRFVAVLLTTQSVMDDRLDDRISFIRKTCGLDTRSSLFVMPGSADIPDWVSNLLRALHMTLQSYFGDHIKRTKKRRNNNRKVVSQPFQVYGNRTLSLAGWNIRYDFKCAAFCELKGDWDAAIKFYETAYQQTTDYLYSSFQNAVGSPSGLIPFSNRYNEAKILADVISYKICYLQLLLDNHTSSLSQLYRHIDILKHLPEHTYTTYPQDSELSWEYRTFVARNFKYFAELLDTFVSSRPGFKLPTLSPSPSSSISTGGYGYPNASVAGSMAFFSMSASTDIRQPGFTGSVSIHTMLQHPGYYYLKAAREIESRWLAWNRVYGGVAASAGVPSVTVAPTVKPAPGRGPIDAVSPAQISEYLNALSRQFPLDHVASVVDLLTKSYDQFKRHKQTRMTLFLASEIARIYVEGGNYDLALRFFERIVKSYRREGWSVVLADLLAQMITCANHLRRTDVVVESTLALASQGDFSKWQEFERVIHTPRPSEALTPLTQDLIIDMEHVNNAPFMCEVIWRNSSSVIWETAGYQIKLSSSTKVLIPIQFHSLNVIFSDEKFNVSYPHAAMSNFPQGVDQTKPVPQYIQLNKNQKNVDLMFITGTQKVVQADVTAYEPCEIKIVAVELVLTTVLGANVKFSFKISDRPHTLMGSCLEHPRRKWWFVENNVLKTLRLDGYGDQPHVTMVKKEIKFRLAINQATNAFLDELYPVTITFHNEEREPVVAFIDVEFRPTNAQVQTTLDGKENECGCRVGSEQAGDSMKDGILRGLDIGAVEPKSSKRFTIFLQAFGRPCERALTLAVNYRLASAPETGDYRTSHHYFHKTETVKINFSRPFDIQLALTPVQTRKASTHNENVSVLMPNRDEDEIVEEYLAVVGLSAADSQDLFVSLCNLDLSMTQKDDSVQRPKIELVSDVDSLISQSQAENRPWKSGYWNNRTFHVRVTYPLDASLESNFMGHMNVRWRRSTSELDGEWTSSRFPLPPISLSPKEVTVSSEVPYPPVTHTAFILNFTLRNRTSRIQEVNINIQASESVVFSGRRMGVVRLLPLGVETLTYQCVALAGGNITLPKLIVSKIDSNDVMAQEVRTVYVTPKTPTMV